MDFKIIWSDATIEDLPAICSHVARDNPPAAKKLGDGILEHVNVLGTFPFIGPACPSFAWSLVFEEQRQIQILHVWHGARDEP
jgi:plasmid stabilization system protein ParE